MRRSKNNQVQRCLILDASCAINISASEFAEDILKALPFHIYISEYVNNQETKHNHLKQEASKGLLTVTKLTNEECELVTDISWKADFKLDDGEIITGAIAISRKWDIAIDDKIASNFLHSYHKNLSIITTPEIIKLWVDKNKPSPDLIQEVLTNIAKKGRYNISKYHSLYSWWVNLVKVRII